MSSQLFALLFALVCAQIYGQSARVRDVYFPEHCDNIAEPTDHLLIEYRFLYANGSSVPGGEIVAPSQLFHVQLTNDEAPIMRALKGMCPNSTREIHWDLSLGVDFSPIFGVYSEHSKESESLSVRIRVVNVTPQSDFQIFDALRTNLSLALDMILEHRGVNAVDEWGVSPLMIAMTDKKMQPVIAYLMNTRKPMVDVNYAKSSGFTALFYAVEHADASIVLALLRRGADPNAASIAESSKGNTPLHYACLLEKIKHAEVLLQYGANPFATNQYGQNAFQVIPGDAVRSTKLAFQKIFQEAEEKLRNQIGSVAGGGPAGGAAARSEL
jgi:Ankyrin repeats (3 copies)/Ankyrin repeat